MSFAERTASLGKQALWTVQYFPNTLSMGLEIHSSKHGRTSP